LKSHTEESWRRKVMKIGKLDMIDSRQATGHQPRYRNRSKSSRKLRNRKTRQEQRSKSIEKSTKLSIQTLLGELRKGEW